MKKVIGIIGPLGSGKNTAADYISKTLNIPKYQISSQLKKLANKKNISRGDLIKFSRKIAKKYGDDYLARKIVENSDKHSFLMVGMRQIGQIDYLKKYCNFTLVAINANPKLRFERIKARQKEGDPVTWEEFVKIEKKDDGESIQRISDCMEKADYIIYNENSLREFYLKLEKVIKNYDRFKKTSKRNL